MRMSARDIDWKSLLIKKYLHYGLNELDCMVLFVADAVLDMQPKTLLTCDILYPYMKASKDEIDSSLSNLIGRKYIQIQQEASTFYSSLDAFKVQIFEDEMKDIALKSNFKSASDRISENLYAYLEGISGPLSPVEKDMVSSWVKQGASEDMIKEACSKTITKSGHISFNRADSLILEMQRGESRKKIGVSTIDENDRKNDALSRAINFSDWGVDD